MPKKRIYGKMPSFTSTGLIRHYGNARFMVQGFGDDYSQLILTRLDGVKEGDYMIFNCYGKMVGKCITSEVYDCDGIIVIADPEPLAFYGGEKVDVPSIFF